MSISQRQPTLAPAPNVHYFCPLLICAALITVFAFLAWHVAIQESPTCDESLFVFSGWVNLVKSDYRMTPEHPSLWKEYAAIPNRGTDIPLDTASLKGMPP